MNASHLWDKSFNNKNKILYEEARNVVTHRKNKKGKTKTELIRDFVDFRGDKWKYLQDHPSTRMALCTSGTNIYNELRSISNSILNPLWFTNTSSNISIVNNPLVAGNGTVLFATSYPNVVTFPLEFQIAFFANLIFYSTANIMFTNTVYPTNTSATSVNYTPGSGTAYNAFPIGITNTETGFSITLNAAGNGLNVTSVTSGQATTFNYTGTNINVTPLAGLSFPQASFNLVSFRIPQTGTQVGWSTNQTSWTYQTVPTMNLKNLYATVAILATASTNIAGVGVCQIYNTPGALVNS